MSGQFTAQVGYQEVYLARAYARLGHKVRVLTTTYVPTNIQTAIGIKKHRPGFFNSENYEIHRLNPFLILGTMPFTNGVVKAVRDFKPDLVIAIAIAKFMPLQVLAYKKAANFLYISSFGDRYKDHIFIKNTGANRIIFFLRKLFFSSIKKGWYKFALKRSDGVIYTTPETQNYLNSEFPIDGLQNKSKFVPLGYDSQDFYFDLKERLRIREKYGINNDDFIIITATKIDPLKGIDKFIETISKINFQKEKMKMFLIGFGNDKYSRYILDYVRTKKLSSFIICLPFMDHNSLRQHLNASDLGIWSRECITIQEAMGTGLYVLLKKDAVLSHLIADEITGSFYVSLNDIADKIVMIRKRFGEQKPEVFLKGRDTIVKTNSRLSYLSIAKQILREFVKN